MINNVHLKAFILSAALMLTPLSCHAFNADSGPVFFIGEDIIHPQGMVISVNEVTRKPFYGGFGTSGKKDDLFLNLTLLNSGSSDQSITLTSDFSLDLGSHHYKPLMEESAKSYMDNVTIAANSQSRIDLTFRVDQEENDAPELLFRLFNSEVRIVCDEKLGKIVNGTDSGYYEKDEVAKTAKILIEAGRLSIAKNLCESILVRYPYDSQFLLLMAKIYSSVEEEEQTAYYLKRIDVTKMNNAEEAEDAAKMAISIGYSDVAVDILAAFDAANLLNGDQKALLARAYYYEDMLNPAMVLLNNLFNSGYSSAKAYFTMGNIYNKSRDNEHAISYWLKAIEADPEYSEALFNIGVGYLNSGDISKARSYWEKVLRSNPDSKTLAAAEEALKGTEY